MYIFCAIIFFFVLGTELRRHHSNICLVSSKLNKYTILDETLTTQREITQGFIWCYILYDQQRMPFCIQSHSKISQITTVSYNYVYIVRSILLTLLCST